MCTIYCVSTVGLVLLDLTLTFNIVQFFVMLDIY